MTAPPVITPANSQEEHETGARNWFAKLHSKEGLSTTDWQVLAQEKTNVPLLQDYCGAASRPLVRVMGMVQDMLDTQYSCASQGLLEQTPLVIAPIPYATPWLRLWLQDDAHRDKRLKLEMDDVSEATEQPVTVAHFYCDQYNLQTKPPKLRLNEIVELVGVLEHDDEQQDVVMGEEEATGTDNMMVSLWEEEMTVPLDLPRLHVLWYNRLNDLEFATPIVLNNNNNNNNNNNALLDEIPQIVARQVGVDPVSAAAIWMALLSLAERPSPHGAPLSTPHETTLGCASLEMILPDRDACTRLQTCLYNALLELVPTVCLLNSTTSCLAAPHKSKGRLQATPLQLPRGATVIVNASDLPHNMETLQALQELVKNHRMPYRFEGAVRLLFEADVRVIVLTTRANVLPCTLQVCCCTRSDLAHNDEIMRTVRNYLSVARQGHTIGLPRQVLDQAQDDFLARRQQGRVGEDDFHRWLTLTRLQARARQATQANLEDWQRALQLDDAMRATLCA